MGTYLLLFQCPEAQSKRLEGCERCYGKSAVLTSSFQLHARRSENTRKVLFCLARPELDGPEAWSTQP
ncbi:unnamed protein product [Calypogeia fissa]